MSGLVHIIAFIRLSTTDALGTRDFSILSASLLGLIREEQLIESEFEIGLQSCMLKRRKIISKYFFWESQTFLSFLSVWICILEILVCWFQVLLLILPSQLCLQFLDLNFVGAYLQHVIHIQHQWSKHPVCCNRGLWMNQIFGTNTWALSLNRTEICSTMQTKFSCSLTPSSWSIISFLLNNNLVGSGTHKWYPFHIVSIAQALNFPTVSSSTRALDSLNW